MNGTTYDGTFPLAFLKDNERVRSAGKDSNAIEILSPFGVHRVELGQTVIRTRDGHLVSLPRRSNSETGTGDEIVNEQTASMA